MSKLTITEALAEKRVIDKRIESASNAIHNYVARQASLVDPLAKQGGSEKYIAEQRQSIHDLLERKISIQNAINQSNDKTSATVHGVTRTIAEWLIWKRDVALAADRIYSKISNKIETSRNINQQRVTSGKESAAIADTVIALDEKQFYEEIAAHQEIENVLDGVLSMKNATTYVDVA